MQVIVMSWAMLM